MLTNEILQTMLSRADWIERAVVTYDDYLRWGRRRIDSLVELGLLREIERASRLRTSTAPVVLVLTRLPKPDLWQEVRPTVLVLEEHVSWNESESRLDVGSLLDMLRTLRPPVREEAWLTVKECALLLMKDLPYIDLNRAKARVSKAANKAKFTTNGRRGTARRIERVSFDAWRLEQRDRDLAKEDAEHHV